MKRYMLFISMVSVLLLVAACGVNVNNDDPQVNNGHPAENVDENNNLNDNNDQNQNENQNENGASENDDDRITEMGTYNGQADPHTIEIETDDGAVAFQLTMDARTDVEDLEPGDKVTYTYTEDGDQREIESIHKVD